jgi:hypothetical protein
MLFLGELEEKPDKFYLPYLISHVTSNLQLGIYLLRRVPESNFQRGLPSSTTTSKTRPPFPDPLEADEN